jgi:hypothetical protein
MWFEGLTGFKESANNVRRLLSMEGDTVCSSVNGKSWRAGHLSVCSLAELRQAADDVLGSNASSQRTSSLTVSEVVADVQALHIDPANSGALFQVASQFNLLEKISPRVTPEAGVTIYENDPTQGPACAVACGAGLIYRNYFVPIGDQLGQSSTLQLNTIDELETALLRLISQKKLGNDQLDLLWSMKNGYALPDEVQLKAINTLISQSTESELDALRQAIKIGVHQNTQVTLNDCTHNVTQAYCSAMPVAYSQHSKLLWQPLAQLILEAAYEATLAAAVLNSTKTGNSTVYLTLLGGGAFGNKSQWITDAIFRALEQYQHQCH